MYTLKGQAIRRAKSQYVHLNDLKLADYPTDIVQDLSADILLGCDVMWKIMTGEIIKGNCDESPVAIGTHFGWVLRTDTNPVIVDYCDSFDADSIMEKRVDDFSIWKL